MTYIRHRPRMVRESIFEDLGNVLGELGWLADKPTPVMAMLSEPLKLTDYFPVEAIYQGEEVELNTLAIDQGTPNEPQYTELGSLARDQLYIFNLAFFAENDGIALSLFSDLSDRYKGASPNSFSREAVTLWNYNAATPTPVVEMEVLSFEVAKSPEQPAPGRLLWFAQLVVSDYLEMGG